MIQTTQIQIDPSLIDFGVGQPQPSLLPLERIRKAAERRFAQGESYFLQYGSEAGDGYLRLELARFLSGQYGFPVDPQELFITNGVSQGLDLICTLYAQPGDTIFVEEPSYFLAHRIFADHRLKPIPIPMDEDGLVVEAVAAELKHARPAFLYTIPTFQNPSGCTLSEERRLSLVELSRGTGLLVVADEVYHSLSYTAHPPRALAGYTQDGNLVSLGSFSKILAPGLRLGWIQTDPARVRQLAHCGLLDSGGGLNPFTSAIIRGVLETGELDANVGDLRAVFSDRMSALGSALKEHLPQVTYPAPQGGYFFWLRLPGEMDAAALRGRAASHGVSFRPGIDFSSQGGLRDYARLSFAFYDEERLVEGVKRLQRLLSSYPPPQPHPH